MDNDVQAEPIDRLPLALGVIGSAFTWCWLFISFNGNAFLYPFPEQTNFYRFLELAGIAVCLLVIVLLGRKKKEYWVKQKLSVTPVIIALPAVMNLILEEFGIAMPLAYSVASWLLLGASVGACFTIWGRYFSMQKMKDVAIYCILSTIIGAILFFTISFEKPFFSVITSYILLLASVAISLLLPLHGSLEPALPYTAANAKTYIPLRLKINVTAFGTAFGVGLFIVFNETATEAMPFLTVLFVPIGCGLLLYWRWLQKGRMSFSAMQKLLLPCMIAALLPMPFMDSPGKFVFGILLMSSSIFFDLTNCVYGIKIVEDNNLSSSFIAAGRLPYQIGEWLGWSLGIVFTVFMGDSEPGHNGLIVLCLTLALILVAVVNYIPVENAIGRSLTVDGETRSLVSKCDTIAAKYSLTPREREVLYFLAKGRNAEYIQEKLGISTNTVRAHIYHIYDKLAVHSQQSLMDAVEEESASENRVSLVP